MVRLRSNSFGNKQDNHSQDKYVPEDGSGFHSKSSKKSKSGRKGKNKLRDRFKQFGGSKEWSYGCGGGEAGPFTAEDDNNSIDVEGPPILTIEVDETKEIDLTERVPKKTDAEIEKKFASAAREAVKTQMDDLECQCSVDTLHNSMNDIDLSARSMPPASMNPTSLLERFGTSKIQEIIIDPTAEPTLGEKLQTRDLVFRHGEAHGCLVFVIRRPGCLLCREQALYLKFLFETYPKEVEGFSVVGVVKEFCDKGGEKLKEFHDKYFPFPLYLDIDKAAYKALGNRKVTIGGALKVLNPFSDTAKRIKKNQINGNMSGEGFLQGGIIIYHKHGMPAYKYEEETGLELPVADIVKALRSVRRDDFVPLPSTEGGVGNGSDPSKESHRHNKKFDMSIRTVG